MAWLAALAEAGVAGAGAEAAAGGAAAAAEGAAGAATGGGLTKSLSSSLFGNGVLGQTISAGMADGTGSFMSQAGDYLTSDKGRNAIASEADQAGAAAQQRNREAGQLNAGQLNVGPTGGGYTPQPIRARQIGLPQSDYDPGELLQRFKKYSAPPVANNPISVSPNFNL